MPCCPCLRRTKTNGGTSPSLWCSPRCIEPSDPTTIVFVPHSCTTKPLPAYAFCGVLTPGTYVPGGLVAFPPGAPLVPPPEPVPPPVAPGPAIEPHATSPKTPPRMREAAVPPSLEVTIFVASAQAASTNRSSQ